MSKIKLCLNRRKNDNFAFFCPVSKIHLTISNPVAYTDRITSYILRGIKNKSVVDVDELIDLEAGTLKKTQSITEDANKEPDKKDNEENENKDVAIETEKEIEQDKEKIEEKVETKPAKKPAAKKAAPKKEADKK